MPITARSPATHITVTEAMGITGVSRATIHRWVVDEGRISAYRVGNRMMLNEAHVRAMIQPVIPRKKTA